MRSAGPLSLATRGSALALTQSRWVAGALAAAGVRVELVVIQTTGDRAPAAGGLADKSRFVKEIEDALLAGAADVAVHSAKDLPGDLPDGLQIAAVPERADPRDALCGACSVDALGFEATVGTASLRRRAQLLGRRPDLRVTELRGNVDTRLRRLREGRCDAIVLATAGLGRLGLSGGVPIPANVMVPAPGQGCLALEVRRDDERTAALLRGLDDPSSHRQLAAERALARRLGADCHTPLGANARLVGDALELTAFLSLPDGRQPLRASQCGDAAAPDALGEALADVLVGQGADRLLTASIP